MPLTVAVSLLAAAAVADLVAHLAGVPALEAPAHMATLVGMVATLAVVVTNGLARRRPAPSDEDDPPRPSVRSRRPPRRFSRRPRVRP